MGMRYHRGMGQKRSRALPLIVTVYSVKVISVSALIIRFRFPFDQSVVKLTSGAIEIAVSVAVRFIFLLKSIFMSCQMGTNVSLFSGIVETTKGGKEDIKSTSQR